MNMTSHVLICKTLKLSSVQETVTTNWYVQLQAAYRTEQKCPETNEYCGGRAGGGGGVGGREAVKGGRGGVVGRHVVGGQGAQGRR